MGADSEAVAAAARRLILEQAHRANVGHIGSALCVVDALSVLYVDALDDAGSAHERDRFVLSKGHAALALYATLVATHRLPERLLETYCADGSLLGTHPDHEAPHVDFTTGSLGQGLSFAAGAALAARLDGSGRRTFALLSDAECDEGATWEAALWAGHQRLENLVVVVDANGQQALGYTDSIVDLEPLVAKWESFRWEVAEVDGHDHAALRGAVCAPPRGRPRVVVARTTFGRGVSFMEGRIEWHYLPLDEAHYRRALAEVAG